MGNRPVNRRRRNTGRTGHYRGSSRSDTLRRRKGETDGLRQFFSGWSVLFLPAYLFLEL